MMKVLSQYLERNKVKVKEIFDNNLKNEQLPATKIFSFLQQVLAINHISFAKDGKQFFKSEDNQGKTQKIIEKYYKTTPDGKSNKFFLYRISFTYPQFLEFMQYWLKTDKSIVIHDPLANSSGQEKPSEQKQQQNESEQKQKQLEVNGAKTEEINLPPELRESVMLDNQFIVEEEKKPMLIAAYNGEIKKMEEMLLRMPAGEESQETEKKIQLLKSKIAELGRSMKSNSTQSKDLSKGKSPLSPKKPKTQGAKQKKQVNFKALFEFYAKQNHLTGVKASFQRIQHQSQTINYQKLVHFLKEYDLFPQKAHNQKKIHTLYVKSCSNTRDLHYSQFMELLIKLPQIVINSPNISPEQKFDTMMQKIQAKSEKNSKVLHNPFHSHEKKDFRIDKDNIKYEFKLKPLKGKLVSEVGYQLEHRKKEKEEMKLEKQKDKEDKKIKKLKLLMAIDPYHPQVVKNQKLLRQKSHSAMDSPPVANLDNMEKFRDNSFDMKARFGIADINEDPLKMMGGRYDIDKRLQLFEKEQSLKMSHLMSGLIERSEAKIAKLGLSPRRKQYSKLH